MRTQKEIEQLLNELELRNADSLEDQDLDFKEWNDQSLREAIILKYLVAHREIDVPTASGICQRKVIEVREILDLMEAQYDYLQQEQGGEETYWKLTPMTKQRLNL